MSEKGREYVAFVPESVYQRIVRDVRREKYITPFIIAEKYNMTLTLAKQVLRRLRKDGVVKLYYYSRRAPIYVPVRK